MGSRKLNALELKIHQAALAEPDKVLSQRKLEALSVNVTARTEALNFLLGTGMLKAMKDTTGVLCFRAVMKKELEVKKDMTGEETMVLSHIQASANEGIWTKHLKAKTELHQTVIDRCIKSLLQKQLIKAVKSVKHPTRKIYMLFHLDPSTEMTGGPWYTDNELDTEFIKLLSHACLHYIKDRSFPKRKSSSTSTIPLFSISAAPTYPTAQQIQLFLNKSKITETVLGVEHIEMLLNVLVLDGEIERVPAFGAALWQPSVGDDDDAADSEEGSDKEERKSKRRKVEKEKERNARGKKRSRKDKEENNDDADGDASDSDARSKSRSRSKSSKKKRKTADDGSEDSDHGSSRKKKRKHEEGTSTDDERHHSKSRKSSKSRSKKSRRASSTSSSTASSESGSDSEDDNRGSRRHSKQPAKRSDSPQYDLLAGGSYDSDMGSMGYRAIRAERVALGWSQAPCGGCPVFDFCKDKGPVNPTECEYYTSWLEAGVVVN